MFVICQDWLLVLWYVSSWLLVSSSVQTIQRIFTWSEMVTWHFCNIPQHQYLWENHFIRASKPFSQYLWGFLKFRCIHSLLIAICRLCILLGVMNVASDSEIPYFCDFHLYKNGVHWKAGVNAKLQTNAGQSASQLDAINWPGSGTTAGWKKVRKLSSLIL